MSSSGSDWDEALTDESIAAAEDARLAGMINAQFAQKLTAMPVPRPTRRKRQQGILGNGSGRAAGVGATRATPEGSPPPVAAKAARTRPSLADLLKEALSVGGSAEETTSAALDAVIHGIQTELRQAGEDAPEVAHGLVNSLSDPLNADLRWRVLSGSIAPAALVHMDEESLLNPPLREERHCQRQERLEQKTTDFISRMNSPLTYMYVCPSCGKNECFAQFRSSSQVKWTGDDPTPTLLHCRSCTCAFRA